MSARENRFRSSGRKALGTPRGRAVELADLEYLRGLLGDGELARDQLIEHLHAIQDAEGCLPMSRLAALAERHRIPMAEVYEVATFYAHFDVVGDDEARPPATTIRVCDSLSCMLAGAEQLYTALDTTTGGGVRVLRAPCMGRCQSAPVAEVGHRHVDRATAESIRAVIDSGDRNPLMPAYQDLETYRAGGGFSTLGKCLAGQLSVDEVIDALSDAGLRGLGGAGFPTGRKWSLVRQSEGPRLMAVNGDEGEPGTFKDRHYLESKPCQFLEGMLIAARVVEAEAVYLYMRDEYPAVLKILAKEIAAVQAAGLAPHVSIHLRRGAGAYICGEESAMIESIEGKRGLPRHRPPYVAQLGIFGRPTLVNNIETLYWVPEIIDRGASWFADQGANGSTGFRSYSVSGRVREPGVKLAPAGVTVQTLIDEYCGGMADGHSFTAYLPGGASGGILPASKSDVPLDFGGKLAEEGCFIGSHAVVILSDRDDMQAVALNLMKFFMDESCGQCTPCRNGTEKAVALMSEEKWDGEALRDLATVMMDASICGLGQAAPNPLVSVMKHFPEVVA